jgi:hypothetical protein
LKVHLKHCCLSRFSSSSAEGQRNFSTHAEIRQQWWLVTCQPASMQVCCSNSSAGLLELLPGHGCRTPLPARSPGRSTAWAASEHHCKPFSLDPPLAWRLARYHAVTDPGQRKQRK